MLFTLNGRSRYIAGNICLVVTLLLLFSMTGWFLAPTDVEAASNVPTLKYDSIKPEKGYVYTIYVTSDAEYYNTIEEIAKAISGVSGHAVKEIVYETYKKVDDMVYGHIQLVYDLPAVPGHVYLAHITTLKAVYAYSYQEPDLRPKVPIPKIYVAPPPAPAPAPAPPPAPVVKTTSTATVTQVGDTATVEPNVEEVARAFVDPALKVALIEITPEITAKNFTVEIPNTLVAAGVDNPKPLLIQAPQFSLELPREMFSLPALQDLVKKGAQFTLKLVTNDKTEAEKNLVAQLIGVQPDADNFSEPIRVFELSLQLVEAGRPARNITDFEGGVASFAANYADEDVEGIDEWKLNFYRQVGGSLQPRLTWVDSKANTATAWLHGFSRYALMAYTKSFGDIVGHWSQADVELMACKHIIKGVTDVSFEPDRNITRAEFATLLQRTLGLRETNEEPIFTDVKADDWYYGAVQAAARAGLVKGYPEGDFRPNVNITRQEMAVMVARALENLSGELTITPAAVNRILERFEDKAEIGNWAREAVAVAVERDIIKGRTERTFVPQANATRAESAAMLKRTAVSAGLLK